MNEKWFRGVLGVTALAFVASLVAYPIVTHDQKLANAVGRVGAVLEARPAPHFDLLGLQGQQAALSDYRGEVVYLNFWGEYCVTCRAEMPSLQAFATEHAQDVTVLTVSLDDDPNLTRAYLDETFPNGAAFDTLMDPGGSIAGTYGTTAVPETYVINRDGVIVAWLIGEQDFTSAAHQDLLDVVLSSD